MQRSFLLQYEPVIYEGITSYGNVKVLSITFRDYEEFHDFTRYLREELLMRCYDKSVRGVIDIILTSRWAEYTATKQQFDLMQADFNEAVIESLNVFRANNKPEEEEEEIEE